jgi:hypothetical protein
VNTLNPMSKKYPAVQTLSTLSLCTCQTTGSKLPPFKRYSQPSPYQKRAFDLLQLIPP